MSGRNQAAGGVARRVAVSFAGILAVTAPLPLLAQATLCSLILHSAKTQEWFGSALGANDQRLAVGAPGDPARPQAQDLGAAYVFLWNGTAWSQEDTLGVGSGGVRDRFGSAVALNGDRLAVGAPAAPGERVAGAGAVYLFSRSGNAWSQESPPRVTAPDGSSGDQFGAAVAAGTDTLVVGAPGNGAAGSLAGAVYVFPRAGGGWGPPQKLLAPDALAADGFGSSVAVAGDLLAAGAPFADAHRRNFGAVYVFERQGDIWFVRQKLTAERFEEDDIQFGASVAIAGGAIVAGARGEDLHDDQGHPAGANAGAAYVFTQIFTPNGSTWTNTSILRPADRLAGDQLGAAVAISGDTVVAGAPFHSVSDTRPGAAFVFVNGAEQGPFSARGSSPDSRFGGSVAVVSGNVVVFGGFLDDPGAQADAGSVAFCKIGPSSPCNQLPAITKTGPAGAVVPGPEISYTVLVANSSTTPLPSARVTDLFDTRLDSVLWCRADGDGACTPVSHTPRDIDETVPLSAGARLTYRVIAHLGIGSTGELPNRACVSIPDCPDRCSTVSNPIGASGVDLRLTGTASPSPVVKGHLLTIRWVVENVRNTRATGVHLLTSPNTLAAGGFDDCLCPKGDCDLGTLEPHETREKVLSCQVPACGGPNSILWQAKVTANEVDLNSADNSAKVTSAISDGKADVAVNKEVLDAVSLLPVKMVKPGARLTYRITVDNKVGPDTACDVKLRDTFRPEFVPIPPIPDPCLVAGECSLGELKKDVERVLEATFQVGQVATCPFDLPNTATVSTHGSTDTDPGNDSSTAVVTVDEVDLTITKEGPATAAVCVPVLYTIRVGNKACHDVRAHVRDDFSPDLLQALWCAGAGCTPALPGPLDHTSTLPLPMGASEEFHVQGMVSPLFQGTLPNTARVDPVGVADAHNADNEASIDTQVDLPPGFQLYCTGVDGPFAEGDLITCVFVLLNGGPSAQADNAGDEFTVTLPASLTLVSASATSGTTATLGNTVTWNGAVPVGGRVDISVKATVNAGTAGTTICIQGSAFLDTDGDGVNDTVFFSDDVHSPCPPADACCFRVLTPAEIPALSEVGMAILALLLTAGAIVRLRARRL
jgi:hypothetical protein